MNISRETQIASMLFEIESMMAKTGVDMDDPIHRTYITATLELNSPDCNQNYVHNILAQALNKPLATRH